MASWHFIVRSQSSLSFTYLFRDLRFGYQFCYNSTNHLALFSRWLPPLKAIDRNASGCHLPSSTRARCSFGHWRSDSLQLSPVNQFDKWVDRSLDARRCVRQRQRALYQRSCLISPFSTIATTVHRHLFNNASPSNLCALRCCNRSHCNCRPRHSSWRASSHAWSPRQYPWDPPLRVYLHFQQRLSTTLRGEMFEYSTRKEERGLFLSLRRVSIHRGSMHFEEMRPRWKEEGNTSYGLG